MTDEEFDRLKEEEKAHFRQMRALKRAVRLLERQRSVTDALEEMTNRSRDALAANEQLIDEIARDTARHEARLDVAMDATDTDSDDLEEANMAMRAKLLVDNLRRQTESPPESKPAPGEAAPLDAGASEPAHRDPLPEKTLGRMRSEPDWPHS